MQDLETYGLMVEHLRLFFVSGLFSPAIWLMWAGVYVFAWIVGRNMGPGPISTGLILVYLVAALIGFLTRSPGWDLLILGGFPFVLGIYVGRKR